MINHKLDSLEISTRRAYEETLRFEAERIGFLIGAAVDPELLLEEFYAETVKRQFNMIEPENALKWYTLRPDRETFQFEPADRIIEFAQKHNQKIRGHNLVWHAFNPKWLVYGNFTANELNSLLREHIKKVMQHYAGKIFAWDVVNEAFDETPHGRLQSSIWYDSPGIGFSEYGTRYVEEIFWWAREADPNALLFYNDYGIEENSKRTDAIFTMIKEFLARKVPIDGIGIQMHVDLTSNLTALKDNLKRFSDLGLQIHITECDVAIPVNSSNAPLNPEHIILQAEIFQEILSTCLSVDSCTGFQTWGVTDKYSWIPERTAGREGNALLFDYKYSPKPAFSALMETLRQAKAKR